MIRALLIVAIMLLSAAARAEELKITTWNLNWLTTRTQGDRHLPADVKPRGDADFDRLRQYALELAADVIAVEEVDGAEAAAKVFPPDRYSIHMTRDHVTQRTGLIVRRGLPYDVNPDVVALAGPPHAHLRSGADITLHLPAGTLRLLAVHLKRGCQERPLIRTTSRACLELRDQIAPLQDWIAARAAEGVAFLVFGDFNRWMDGRDQFLAALRKAAPLTRATEGRSSPCWGSENFIDHILAGGPARDWMRTDTLRVMRFRETGAEWKDRLSDHCPVSVQLVLPSAGG